MTDINGYGEVPMAARIVYRWPTAPSPIWEMVRNGIPPTDAEERCLDNHREQIAFSSPYFKRMTIRHYTRMRQLGAPRSAARWAVMMAVQRQLVQRTWVTFREPDGSELPIGSPVAWFIPTCDICQSYGEPPEVWESHSVEDVEACPHQEPYCTFCETYGHDTDDCPDEPIDDEE